MDYLLSCIVHFSNHRLNEFATKVPLSFAKMLSRNETRESETGFVLSKRDRWGFACLNWRPRRQTGWLGQVATDVGAVGELGAVMRCRSVAYQARENNGFLPLRDYSPCLRFERSRFCYQTSTRFNRVQQAGRKRFNKNHLESTKFDRVQQALASGSGPGAGGSNPLAPTVLFRGANLAVMFLIPITRLESINISLIIVGLPPVPQGFLARSPTLLLRDFISSVVSFRPVMKKDGTTGQHVAPSPYPFIALGSLIFFVTP